MHKRITWIFVIALISLLTACQGEPSATPTQVPPSPTVEMATATTPPATATPQPAETASQAAVTQVSAGTGESKQQIAAGQKVYTQYCSACHGENFQGVSGPALTQSSISTFGNGKAFVEFVSDEMPQGAAGSLTKTQYYDVSAYILANAGDLPSGEALTSDNAASIQLKAGSGAGPSGPVATKGPQEKAVVKLAEVPDVGNFLTNDDGFTLYYYGKDKPGESNCTGSCANIFPPFTVPADVRPVVGSGIPGTLGVVKRQDGEYQVTYNDPPAYKNLPLYTYYGDVQPGEAQGDLYEDEWHIVSLTQTLTTTTTASTPSQAIAQGNAALGAPTYLEDCTPCHGNQGQGIDAPPLRNSKFVQDAGDQAIFGTIANGRPNTEMPAWLQDKGGPLTDQEIGNVVAYLHTLQDVSSLAPQAPEEESEPEETPLPTGAPTPEPARPSMSGGNGEAVNLTGSADKGQPEFGRYCASCHGPQGVQGIPNPGSEDESVPVLNPIDPTIANPDAKIFAKNVDLFIQHGSVPEGSNPLIIMPSFGDSKALTQQQIADIIDYIISLNGGK